MIQAILQLLFPIRCLICDRHPLPPKHKICLFCESALPIQNYPDGNHPIAKVFWGRLPLEHASAWLQFRKGNLARTLLHKVKYGGSRKTGEWMGQQYASSLIKTGSISMDNLPEVLVPVPLHRKKRRKRGFNQAEAIANGMSSVLGIPVETRALNRVTHQASLTKLGRNDRWERIRQSYQASDEICVKLHHVWLIDDVVTTGATIDACGQALLSAGVNKLSIGCLAYTEKHF